MSVKIQEVIDKIEVVLPPRLQEPWDNCGLQVGQTGIECRGVLLTLDITEAIIEEARERDCNLIVAHHPLLFKGLKRIGEDTYIERCVRLAIKHDIAIYAAHTNADVARRGLNMLLGEELGLQDLQILSPTTGTEDGLGVIGTLKEPKPLASYLQELSEYFETEQIRYNHFDPERVYRVAVVGGAGAFLAKEAERQGADIFITGEAKYNDYYDTEGITLITVGHYESEFVAVRLFERIISAHYPGICKTTEINHNPVKTLK